ncbi:MAG: class I fructose-bisphosphate aldolase, partial [Streptosporangiaceae bacterium]
HPRPGHARDPQLDLGRRPGMTAREVLATARALVAGDRGLLAMDESNPTCDKRFARAGIAQRVWSDEVATGS